LSGHLGREESARKEKCGKGGDLFHDPSKSQNRAKENVTIEDSDGR
jgi:hypothetical protein